MTGTTLAIIARRTGATVLPDESKGYMHRLQVNGSTGNAYVVALRLSDQVWCCSCRGWIGHRNCKHLSAMLPALTAAFPGTKAATPIRRIKG